MNSLTFISKGPIQELKIPRCLDFFGMSPDRGINRETVTDSTWNDFEYINSGSTYDSTYKETSNELPQ